MKRRNSLAVAGLPLIICCQEKVAGRPAKAVVQRIGDHRKGPRQIVERRPRGIARRPRRARAPWSGRAGSDRGRARRSAAWPCPSPRSPRVSSAVDWNSQPLRAKNSLPCRIVDRTKQFRLTGQMLGQLAAGGGGQFRRRRVDDNQGRVEVTGKLRFKTCLALAPVQMRREQLVDVGGDGEVSGEINRRGGRRAEACQDDQPGKAGAESDNSDNRGPKHGKFAFEPISDCRGVVRRGTHDASRNLLLVRPAARR